MTDGRAECRLRAAKGKQKIGRFTEVFTTCRWLPRSNVASLTAPFGGRPKSRRRSAVRRDRRSTQLDPRSVHQATRMRHFARSCRWALSLDRTSEFGAVRWPLNNDCDTLVAHGRHQCRRARLPRPAMRSRPATRSSAVPSGYLWNGGAEQGPRTRFRAICDTALILPPIVRPALLIVFSACTSPPPFDPDWTGPPPPSKP